MGSTTKTSTKVNMKTHRLVLSIEAALNAICSGLDPAELENALFYLGCTRTSVFVGVCRRERKFLESIYEPPVVDSAYRSLVGAIFAAEEQGNVVWTEPYESQNWGELNAFLEARELPVIDLTELSPKDLYGGLGGTGGDFVYPTLVRLVKDQKLPYSLLG